MSGKIAVAVVFLLVGASGCATEVIRKQPQEVVDLSGRWNDTDARVAAEEAVKSCLTSGWLPAFNKAQGRDPVIIVGSVVNRSHEHIDGEVFVRDMEAALVGSGKVRAVASKEERGGVREERLEQQDNATPETRARIRQETGADFMLMGAVRSVKDETRGQYAILFQVNLELVDLTSNEKVWIGETKIKKLVKRPQYSM